ncbi:hypothetical protein NDU88_002174 [Pleurodeles waltl]|uniref:Uncharacterized protein n=1 Tax=Pleurodeles waltl TaxID=8319 RepID=A0AAV7W292_PLEWA|nr:hypothetical protein NDU88_002174 [Pleurodeles waltl]
MGGRGLAKDEYGCLLEELRTLEDREDSGWARGAGGVTQLTFPHPRMAPAAAYHPCKPHRGPPLKVQDPDQGPREEPWARLLPRPGMLELPPGAIC